MEEFIRTLAQFYVGGIYSSRHDPFFPLLSRTSLVLNYFWLLYALGKPHHLHVSQISSPVKWENPLLLRMPSKASLGWCHFFKMPREIKVPNEGFMASRSELVTLKSLRRFMSSPPPWGQSQDSWHSYKVLSPLKQPSSFWNMPAPPASGSFYIHSYLVRTLSPLSTSAGPSPTHWVQLRCHFSRICSLHTPGQTPCVCNRVFPQPLYFPLSLHLTSDVFYWLPCTYTWLVLNEILLN